jgi:hypothetical protein
MGLIEPPQPAGLRVVRIIEFAPILNEEHHPWLSARTNRKIYANLPHSATAPLI